MAQRILATFVTTLAFSLGSLGALALPSIDFCEKNPDSPLCVPDDPGPDSPFCDRFPESPVCSEEPPPVDPGDPPVDPCIRRPELCEPPVVEDPPVVDPPEEEPPVEEPPAPTFAHELSGSAKLKGRGFKTSQPYTLRLNFDTSARTFLAMDEDGTLYSGNLAPKGKKGTKFALFLDNGSDDAFSADVAARAGVAAGRAAGSVLGASSKLVLKLKQGAPASLKIKREVLVDGIGEVVFKANLTGAPAAASASSARSSSFVDNWRVQR